MRGLGGFRRALVGRRTARAHTRTDWYLREFLSLSPRPWRHECAENSRLRARDRSNKPDARWSPRRGQQPVEGRVLLDFSAPRATPIAQPTEPSETAPELPRTFQEHPHVTAQISLHLTTHSVPLAHPPTNHPSKDPPPMHIPAPRTEANRHEATNPRNEPSPPSRALIRLSSALRGPVARSSSCRRGASCLECARVVSPRSGSSQESTRFVPAA